MTRRNISAAVVAAFIAAFVAASASRWNSNGDSKNESPASASAANVEETVLALENDWTKALVSRDTGAFRGLTAPDLVYTEDSIVMNQNELMQLVATSPDTIEWAGNEQMKLYDYSPTAVVTGILVIRGRSKGMPFTNRYRYTDTWLNRDGKWQVIAAQDYLMPK